MGLTTIQQGSEIKSTTLNENFEYLDGRITDNAQGLVTVQSNLQSAQDNLGDQINELGSTIASTTSAVYEYSNSSFTLREMVVADSLNANTSNPSAHEDALWLYATPVYPYVPMTTQTSGTSHTFSNGGAVMCTSSTNVTVGQGSASITFTGFVGMLPVSPGAVVTTSATSYFINY